MERVPLFIVSDAITSPSGLARITRELAVRIHANLSDVFEVGVAGYGGGYSKKFGFPNYPISMEGNWTLPQLPAAWFDFAGDRKGVIMFVWNCSWLSWVANPQLLPEGDLKRFMLSGQFKKWLYCPIDSEGPDGKLSEQERDTLKGFDRVLAYTQFGADVIERTIESKVPHLPHGTDENIFYPRSRSEARKTFGEKVFNKTSKAINEAVTLIGVCATNTARKDWGLAFETCGELLRRGVNVGLWAHTDRFQKAGGWDLLALADAFDMRQRVMFSNGHLSDDDMAWAYAAMDVVLCVGAGEGWGFSGSEALACGIPAIHGNYAGQVEYMPKDLLIEPAVFRLDGYYGNRRPVFKAADWADKVEVVARPFEEKRLSRLDPRHYWSGCFPQWAEWLKAGIE